jgi:hypothetical protein
MEGKERGRAKGNVKVAIEKKKKRGKKSGGKWREVENRR